MTPKPRRKLLKASPNRGILARTKEAHGAGMTIRRLRTELDMSQSELARVSGMTFEYISRLERATLRLKLNGLCKLAYALGLTPSEFMAELEHDGVIAKDDPRWDD